MYVALCRGEGERGRGREREKEREREREGEREAENIHYHIIFLQILIFNTGPGQSYCINASDGAPSASGLQ